MTGQNRDKKYWMHGSTFFNSGYVDYLDANFPDTSPELYEREMQPPYQPQQEEEEEYTGDWTTDPELWGE